MKNEEEAFESLVSEVGLDLATRTKMISDAAMLRGIDEVPILLAAAVVFLVEQGMDDEFVSYILTAQLD